MATEARKNNGGVSPTAAADTEQRERAFQALSTPLIDISNMTPKKDKPKHQSGLSNNSSNNEDDNMLLFAPLHRDGEQARLVEEVRKRQRQQLYEEEEEDSSFAQWFWELLYDFGGLTDDPRRNNINTTDVNTTTRSSNATTTPPPPNPYRDSSRLRLLNKHKSNNIMNGNTHTADSDDTNTNQSSYYTPPDLSNYPRIVRFIYYILLQRILFALRRCIDFCIMRLAHLPQPPLPTPFSPTNIPMYSSSPTYTLNITADDIICALVIIWVAFYCSSRMQIVAVPMVIMLCLLIASVCRRVVKRVHSSSGMQTKQQILTNKKELQQESNGSISTTALPTTSNNISNNGITTLRDQHLKSLQKQYPNATHAECERFYKCVKYNEEAAAKRMDAFFQWRSDCGLATVAEKEVQQKQQHADKISFDEKKDEEYWNEAAKAATAIITKSHVTDNVAKLPQIICSYEEHHSKDDDDDTKNDEKKDDDSQQPPRCIGTRIMHILPFRLDLSIATAPTYSLAAALYLDRCLSRCSTERITLFVDVRGGRGWSNPTPWSTLPFIQSTASLLGSNYPERLERLVLVPMPRSAVWVWSAAQKCLDPNTASKVVVVSAKEGSSGLPEKLNEFVDEKSLAILEQRRRSFFIG